MDNRRWVPLDISCEYCGLPLEAAISSQQPVITFTDSPKLDFRHAHNKSEVCYIKRTASPYDRFTAARAYLKRCE